MTDFVQFVANSAAVVPATSEVVYDKFWMTSFRVMAQNPNQKVRMVAELVPARDVNGVKELMPDGQAVQVSVKDVFDRAATNPEFAAVMNNVFSQIQTIGIEQGVIKA